MARLIDADEFKEEVSNSIEDTFHPHTKTAIKHFCKWIDEQPTVEMEQVPHARKIIRNRPLSRQTVYVREIHGELEADYYGVGRPLILAHKVDVSPVEYCGRCNSRLDDIYQKYCPNCGAKMDEVE